MGWIKKGKEHQIPSNTGRKRVNINGAMNAEDPTEVYTDMTDRVNAQSTIRLLKEIIANNTEKENIYIIRLDVASIIFSQIKSNRANVEIYATADLKWILLSIVREG